MAAMVYPLLAAAFTHFLERFVVLKRLRVRLWLIALSSSMLGGCVVFPDAVRGAASGENLLAVVIAFITSVVGLVNSWVQRKERRDAEDYRALKRTVSETNERQDRVEVRFSGLEKKLEEGLRETNVHIANVNGTVGGQMEQMSQALNALAMGLKNFPRPASVQAPLL